MPVAIGVDIGGTKIAAGIVTSPGGTVRGRRLLPTRPERGGRAVLDDAHGDGFAHNVESILEPGPPPRGGGTRFPTKFHHGPG